MYENYERLRKERGYTDYEVAAATGIATATLSSWKNGKYTPKADKLLKIADFLNVGLEDLVRPKEIA